MRGLFLTIICVLLIAVPPWALWAQDGQNLQHKVEALEAQSQKYLQEQKPGLAIPVLREITHLDPKNLGARANLGVLLFFQGDYTGAIPQMRTALQLKPDLWKIRALLGIAEKRTGDSGRAQDDLEQALSKLDDPKIRMQAGLELIELDSSAGELQKALSVTEELERESPQDPHLLFVAYEISSQVLDQTLLNMMVAAPNSAEMHMMMAGALARRGDHSNAIEQYREAIRLNPDLPGVHYELAEQLRTATDPALNAQAEGEFRAALKVNQYDEKAWRRLGEIIAAKGDYKTAQEDYKKALALAPHDSDVQTDLAIALISTNHTQEAIPLLESAEKDDPTNVAAHYRLSLLYRRAGRLADSKREMDLFVHYRDLKAKLGNIFKQMAGGPAPK